MTLLRESRRLVVREHTPADLDDAARNFADPALALGGDEARERGLPRLIAFIVPGDLRSAGVVRHAGFRPVARVEWFGRPHDRWELELR